MSNIPNTSLNIFQLRELVAQFVDLYCDELLQMHNKAPAEISEIIELIARLKRERFLAVASLGDVSDWYLSCVSGTNAIPQFAPFLERGYEFLMIHFYNIYGNDRFGELITTASHAFASTFVAVDSSEFHSPLSKRMSVQDWTRVVGTYPWLIFVALLRNTYINMGEDPEPNPSPNGGNDANS